MPFCPVFTQRIAAFETALLEARGLLEEYGKTGDAEIAEQIKDKLAHLREEREAFVQGEYANAVKRLLAVWMENPPEGVPFTIDEAGRIIGSKYARTLQLWSYSGRQLTYKTSYFPRLIRRMGNYLMFGHDAEKNYPGVAATAQEFDFLEEIYGNLEIGEEHRSFNNLKTIGVHLDVKGNNSNRTVFPALEEVGWRITLPYGMEDFLAMFPKLRHVGRDHDGCSFVFPPPRSLWDMGNTHRIKEQIETLKAQGKIHIEGTIKIG